MFIVSIWTWQCPIKNTQIESYFFHCVNLTALKFNKTVCPENILENYPETQKIEGWSSETTSTSPPQLSQSSTCLFPVHTFPTTGPISLCCLFQTWLSFFLQKLPHFQTIAQLVSILFYVLIVVGTNNNDWLKKIIQNNPRFCQCHGPK